MKRNVNSAKYAKSDTRLMMAMVVKRPDEKPQWNEWDLYIYIPFHFFFQLKEALTVSLSFLLTTLKRCTCVEEGQKDGGGKGSGLCGLNVAADTGSAKSNGPTPYTQLCCTKMPKTPTVCTGWQKQNKAEKEYDKMKSGKFAYSIGDYNCRAEEDMVSS